MADRQEGKDLSGVEVTLGKDVWLYQCQEGSSSAFRAETVLPKGEKIQVGGAEQMVRLHFDHRTHEFTPVLEELVDDLDMGISGKYFIRTDDLPPDF